MLNLLQLQILKKDVKGANIIYSDVWVSMGESNWEDSVKLLTPYRITMDMLKMTGNADNGQLIFMHCLPAPCTETEYG